MFHLFGDDIYFAIPIHGSIIPTGRFDLHIGSKRIINFNENSIELSLGTYGCTSQCFSDVKNAILSYMVNVVTVEIPKDYNEGLEHDQGKELNQGFWLNTEDKTEDNFACVFCQGETKNIRIFDIEIKGIGEY